MKILLLLGTLMLSVTTAFAQEHESHNFLQLNYVLENPEGEPVEPSGWGVLGRYDFNENIFIRAEIEDLADGGVDVSAHALALAYIFNPDSDTSFHIAALIEHEDEQEGFTSNHSLGKGIEFGFHAEFSHTFTLHGELSLVNENNDETIGAEIGLLYNFSEPFGLNIEFGLDEDKNSAIEIGLRYTFH